MKLINAYKAYLKVRGIKYTNTTQVNKWITDNHLQVIHEESIGGDKTMRFLDEDAVNALLVTHEREVAGNSPTEVHLGALETKIDRLEQRVLGLTTDINSLVKAINGVIDNQANAISELKLLISKLS